MRVCFDANSVAHATGHGAGVSEPAYVALVGKTCVGVSGCKLYHGVGCDECRATVRGLFGTKAVSFKFVRARFGEDCFHACCE